jgi:4-carboxymuconolactone decarboxylase
MSECLPEAYTSFRSSHPEVAAAIDNAAATVDGHGSMAPAAARLVKLGIAIGAGSEGSVRSSVRKALDVGVSSKDIRHCEVLYSG